MNKYESLVDAILAMRKEGYKEDFNLHFDRLESENGRHSFVHQQFKVDKVIRVNVDHEAEEQAIVYAISSDDGDVKGLLVNAFGLFNEELTDGMVKKLRH